MRREGVRMKRECEKGGCVRVKRECEKRGCVRVKSVRSEDV